ncbi:hypothetical protein CGJ24_24255 [Vibrio parahaemolyticus]|nr:hypothetical protein CGJ24_24255 [Vibrio parahaemolyticus]
MSSNEPYTQDGFVKVKNTSSETLSGQLKVGKYLSHQKKDENYCLTNCSRGIRNAWHFRYALV